MTHVGGIDVIGLWKVTYKQPKKKNCSFPTCKRGLFFFVVVLFAAANTYIMYPAFSWMLLTSSSWASRCVTAQSPFQIDATQAPGATALGKAQPVSPVFVSSWHFSEFLSANSCFFEAWLSLHSAFSPRGRRACVTRRHWAGRGLLRGSSFTLLFCM